MTRIWLFPVACTLVLLSACSVGPHYTKPEIHTPPAYREDPPDQFKEAGLWKTAQPSDVFKRVNGGAFLRMPNSTSFNRGLMFRT